MNKSEIFKKIMGEMVDRNRSLLDIHNKLYECGNLKSFYNTCEQVIKIKDDKINVLKSELTKNQSKLEEANKKIKQINTVRNASNKLTAENSKLKRKINRLENQMKASNNDQRKT